MTHFAYVTAAYAFSALALAALLGWILLDQAARKRELADLERRGVRRRSDSGSAAT
ncbi:MAG TPA: heme exporter protein CcmD [Kiloniellales bacterium]|nr:heme exporter protein CcmD [Kiloniellales bacterium]